MFKEIWIPNWLYNGLPRSAVLCGGFGMIACSGVCPLMVLALAVFAYGFAILSIRSIWNS